MYVSVCMCVCGPRGGRIKPNLTHLSIYGLIYLSYLCGPPLSLFLPLLLLLLNVICCVCSLEKIKLKRKKKKNENAITINYNKTF